MPNPQATDDDRAMNLRLPTPAIAKRLFAIGWVIWMLWWVTSVVTGSDNPTAFGLVSVVWGFLALPLGPLMFLDVDGVGSDWARSTPGGRSLDADGRRRVARFGGGVFTILAVFFLVGGLASLLIFPRL